jgi:hypothetical protein
VCKIALRGAATRHCINGDFAHAVGRSDRLLKKATLDLGQIATQWAGRVRKIAPEATPNSGASQGDFAHPTS